MADLRFATIGTSGICEQFLLALEVTPGALCVGAYSRDVERARSFAAPHGATLFFDSLSDLAACPEVDAVYVASPNALHAPQALEMIAAGKHVLVEKAFASNEREAREVFDAAREAGVVAMEATRNLHVPAFEVISRTVAELGRVRQATLRFAKVTSRMARLEAGERINIFDPLMSAGALMDIGVYCVEPAVALFGRPIGVCALGATAPVPGEAPDGPYSRIDLTGEALLDYGDKVVGLSYGKTYDDVLPSQVAGERATLTWETISCPEGLRLFEHEDKGMVFRVEGPAGRLLESSAPERDMTCEIADFVAAAAGDACALERRDWCERVTLDSLSVMDEVRRQLGVRFPADDR